MSRKTEKGGKFRNGREFIEAVLRIEFYDEPSMKKAADILRKYRYIIYER